MLWFFPLWFTLVWGDNSITPPSQPTEGPGGADYAYDSVRMSDYGERPDGYWLFEPSAPRPDSAPVVVFNHGYGSYNPMIYGQWIRHLVRRGNIVIFPRYQRNLFTPGPEKFAGNVATAIRDAFLELRAGDHVRPAAGPLVMAGHSYGGTIAAFLAIHYADYGIPQPQGVLLVSPGTGPFKGGRLDSYEAMPADTRLLIVVSNDDKVVGDELGELIFSTAIHTPQRNLLRQFADGHGDPPVQAGHNQAYALDTNFDNGRHNISYQRALLVATLDAVDYYGYWKLFDSLLACTRSGQYCDCAFGNTSQQRSLGRWSDGTPVRELDVRLPE